MQRTFNEIEYQEMQHIVDEAVDETQEMDRPVDLMKLGKLLGRLGSILDEGLPAGASE